MPPTKEELVSAHKKLTRRCNNREETLLKKAYELYDQSEKEAFMLFHRTNTDEYEVFSSQPDRNFPPSKEFLVSLLT